MHTVRIPSMRTRVRIILTVRIPSMRTRVRIILEYANELAVYIIITLFIYIYDACTHGV